MPDGYSNISGLLKVFPSTIAPTIDFDNSTKLFIRENQAVGQVVVQFTPSGTSNITNLNFVQGEGDKHNSLFTLMLMVLFEVQLFSILKQATHFSVSEFWLVVLGVLK